MKCKMMAATRRGCQHKVKQFNTQCSFLPNIAELDALCVIGPGNPLAYVLAFEADVVVEG